MKSEEKKEVPLKFAIIHMRDRTDPEVASWVSANDLDVIKGRYIITNGLPTGEYELISI